MYRIKFFILKYGGSLLVIAIFGLLIVAKTVFGNSPTQDISMKPVATSSLSTLIQTVVNVVAGIGAGVFLIVGTIRTFGIAAGVKVLHIGKKTSDGSGDTIIYYFIETLGHIFFSIFIFYALHGLGGVIRGVAERAFGAGVQ